MAQSLTWGSFVSDLGRVLFLSSLLVLVGCQESERSESASPREVRKMIDDYMRTEGEREMPGSANEWFGGKEERENRMRRNCFTQTREQMGQDTKSWCLSRGYEK